MDASIFSRLLVMALIPLILLVLPVRLSYKPMMMLAFALWATGGLMMIRRGIELLGGLELDTTTLAIGVVAALVIGFVKGKFILGKASIRNILRLQAMETPQKPIHVYPLRSWVTIGIMLLISIALSVFGAPLFTRALVNLGIGMGLLVSSLLYLRYMNAMNAYPYLQSSEDPKP
jgi:hypothetical protein